MDPRQRLFRKAALEKMASPERLDELMHVTAPAGWLWLTFIILILVGIVTWSVVGYIPIKVHGTGILIRGEVRTISAGSPGQLVEILAQPGEIVEPGQVVASVGQPGLRLEIENAQEELATLERQTGEQNVNVSRVLQQLRRRRQDLIADIEVKKQALEGGLITRRQLLDARGQLTTVDSQITDLRSQGSERSLRIDQLKNQIEELQSQLAGSTEVVSAYRGRVLEVMQVAGDLVAPGTRLFNLELLEGPVDARLYIPAGDGKRVKEGMEVRIAPATVKPEEYGFILGTVKSTSDFPITQEGLARALRNEQLVKNLGGDAAQIEVIADLKERPDDETRFQWSSSEGPPGEIFTGTICTASVVIEKRRPISYVIPIFKDFTGLGT